MQPIPSIHHKMNKNTISVGWKLYLTVNVLFHKIKEPILFVHTMRERERGREGKYRLSITDVIC